MKYLKKFEEYNENVMRDSNGVVLGWENTIEVNGKTGHIIDFLEDDNGGDVVMVKFDDNKKKIYKPNQLTIIK